MSLSRRAILLVLVLQFIGLGLLGFSAWQRERGFEDISASNRRDLELAGLARLEDAFADLFITVDQLRTNRDRAVVAMAIVEVDHILGLIDRMDREFLDVAQRDRLASVRSQYWGVRQALTLLARQDMTVREALTNAAVTAVYANTYQLQELTRDMNGRLGDIERARVRDRRARRQLDLLLPALWLLLSTAAFAVYHRKALRPWRVLEELNPGRLDPEGLLRLEQSGTPELASIGHTLGRLVQGRNKLHVRHQQQVDELNQRLAESNRVRNDFLAGISHEIRTPMNNLVGNLELLDASLGDQGDHRRIHSIQHAVDDLLAVINDLLAFSRLENEELELNPIDFDLSQAVEAICASHSQQAFEKGLEFTCILESGLPELLRGDAGRLRQVLNNLVGNAVKFTSEGLVEVRTSLLHGGEGQCSICFEIRDTGIGIAPDRLPHLFEPFVQAEGSLSRSHEGLGLGLSISRRLVELLGGRITVRSQPGRGSVFTFKIQFEVLRAHHPPVSPRSPVLLVEQDAGVCEALHNACADLGAPSSDVEEPAAARDVLAAGQADRWSRPVVLLSLGVVQNATREALESFHSALPEGSRVALLVNEGLELGEVRHLLPSTEAVLHRPLRRQALKALLDGDRTGNLDGLVWLQPVSADPPAPDEGRPAVLQAVQAAPAAAAPIAGPWSGYRILAVDDNPVNLKLIENQLEKRGYQLLTADDGESALELLARESVDLVLMDCMMPRLDGLTATRRFREREQGRWTRVIALTANAVGGDRERCISAGMDDYLEKPVRRAALYAMLDRYLPPREMPVEPEPSVVATEPVAPTESSPAPQSKIETPAPEAEVAHLDLRVIQDDSEGDREFEEQLIHLFIRDARKRLGNLEAAIEGNKADQVHLEAHTVKGICAGIGAVAMGQLAMELEHKGSRGDLSEARELLDLLRSEYGHVERKLEEYLQPQV